MNKLKKINVRQTISKWLLFRLCRSQRHTAQCPRPTCPFSRGHCCVWKLWPPDAVRKTCLNMDVHLNWPVPLEIFHTYIHTSVECTTNLDCSPWPSLCRSSFLMITKKAVRGVFGGTGDGWGKKNWYRGKQVVLWVSGRLIHQLFILFLWKQIFPCPAGVLAFTIDWASYFCHWLAAHNFRGSFCQVILRQTLDCKSSVCSQ